MVQSEEYGGTTTFKIGDKVVHPYHGAGMVIDIEEKEFLEEFKRYYVIDLIAYERTLMIPIENAHEIGLRQAFKATAIPHIMDILRAPPERLPGNYRKRQAWIKEKMEEGDVESITEVLRDLVWYRREDRLTKIDARLYERAQMLLAGELALAEGIKLKEAKERLHAALKTESAGVPQG